MWSCLVLMRSLLGLAVGWIVVTCSWSTGASVRTWCQQFGDSVVSDHPTVYWCQIVVSGRIGLALFARIVLFVKGKKYFRIPLILQKAGLIARKSSDGNIGEGGAVGSGEDIDIAAMEVVRRVEDGDTTAVCPTSIPSSTNTTWQACEGLTPVIRCYLVTALVCMKHDSNNTEELAAVLTPNNKISLGDQVLDQGVVTDQVPDTDMLHLADAYYEDGNFPKAKTLYESLSQKESCSDDPYTWLLLGHCHDEMGQWKDAVRCYETVLRKDSTNATAKLRLFALQQVHMASDPEVFTMNIHAGLSGVKAMLKREDYYDWYTMMLGCCIHLNKLRDALILTLGGLSSLLMDSPDSRISRHIQVHVVYVAEKCGHNDLVSDTIGLMLYTNPSMAGCWNLFYTVYHKLQRPRLHRLGVRWIYKNKHDFNGLYYNALHTYRHKHYTAGIAFFRQCLAQQPQNPNIYFNLMLFYLHWVCSKNAEVSKRRHEFVIQAVACAFLFHQLRGPCQETLYNIGRCYHALGLRHFARIYYTRALNTPPTVSPYIQQQVDLLNESEVPPLAMKDTDLTREIVFNLCEVYSASGSDHLARQLLYKHSVI
eukprot:sb/3463246/